MTSSYSLLDSVVIVRASPGFRLQHPAIKKKQTKNRPNKQQVSYRKVKFIIKPSSDQRVDKSKQSRLPGYVRHLRLDSGAPEGQVCGVMFVIDRPVAVNNSWHSTAELRTYRRKPGWHSWWRQSLEVWREGRGQERRFCRLGLQTGKGRWMKDRRVKAKNNCSVQILFARRWRLMPTYRLESISDNLTWFNCCV